MSYGVDDNYGLAEDVAVYSFESLGQDDNLGGLLLDDSYDTFNQDTFDTEPIGKEPSLSLNLISRLYTS